MRRKIPSTVALSAFEAAARHQSFTKAAEELSVTQSAICRQIAVLEDLLGVKLFRRTKRGVTVTEAGLSYARSVRARLDEAIRRRAPTPGLRPRCGPVLRYGSRRPREGG